MLDYRMLIIDFLSDHVNWPRRCFELGSINRQFTFGRNPGSRCGRGPGRGIANGDFLNRGMSRSGDAVHFDTLVNHRVVIDRVVVDDGRVVVNLRDLR